jgi:hypothetical protein
MQADLQARQAESRRLEQEQLMLLMSWGANDHNLPIKRGFGW